MIRKIDLNFFLMINILGKPNTNHSIMANIQTSTIKSYSDKNEMIIQKFTDQHFYNLLCQEIFKLVSLGKTRGIITIYCDEMKDIVQTIQNNKWPSMSPNKLILHCMLNIIKTDKFDNLFFKVYHDEDYKVLINLKGCDNEKSLREAHFEKLKNPKDKANKKKLSLIISSNLCDKIRQLFRKFLEQKV